MIVLLGAIGYVRLETEIIELRARLDGMTPAGTEPEPPAAPRDLDAGGAWACTGTIAPDMVRTAIGQHGPSVFECGSRANARGLLLVEARIDARGHVAEVRFGGTARNDALTACVAEAARSWRFPPPIGGDCAIVSAPFRLGGD